MGQSKSPDAFRTISEVAAEIGVEQHVLRFWETKFPSVKPVKRAGGRRYYRPGDVDLLGGIRLLLKDDMIAIKGVQRILAEKGPAHVAGLPASRGLGPDGEPAETAPAGSVPDDATPVEETPVEAESAGAESAGPGAPPTAPPDPAPEPAAPPRPAAPDLPADLDLPPAPFVPALSGTISARGASELLAAARSLRARMEA